MKRFYTVKYIYENNYEKAEGMCAYDGCCADCECKIR